MELNEVYTGKETDLIGLHARLRRCQGKSVYCHDPECTKVFVRFDDPDLPNEHHCLSYGYTVFDAQDFAIEDPESPLAPQNAV